MKNYEITPEQREEFVDLGFLLIPDAIPVSLLSKWQSLLTELNENALTSYIKSSKSPNVSFIEGMDKPQLSRVNDLLAFFPDTVLDLLACPVMMAIARNFPSPSYQIKKSGLIESLKITVLQKKLYLKTMLATMLKRHTELPRFFYLRSTNKP